MGFWDFLPDWMWAIGGGFTWSDNYGQREFQIFKA